MTLRALSIVVTASLLLSACVELDGVLEVKPDGSAINRVEIRVTDAVVREVDRQARAAKRQGKRDGDAQTFAQMCNSAFASSPDSKSEIDAKLPVVPTTGAVSTRGKWTICTITETIADPAGHYTQIASAFGLSPDDEKLERLPDGNGYRYKSSLRFVKVLQAAMGADAIAPKDIDEFRRAIPASAKLTFAITSQRIADTDGKLDPDGRTARWSYPLRRLLDRSPTAPPLDSRAVILFR